MRTFATIVLACVGISPVLARAQSFNSVDTTHNLNYFNDRPMPPNAYRVLFIGDSLTYHGQTANLWNYDSGMAASSPENDFVHRVTQHLQARLGTRPVEILINNGGNGKIGAMLMYLKGHPELKPDLVILQGGENDPFDDAYRQNYQALLGFYQAARAPYIVLGDWWNETKSAFDHDQALARGYAWVDLTAVDKDPAMSGDGGPYHVEGVAKHPNDRGMQAIAEAIGTQFDQKILPR